MAKSKIKVILENMFDDCELIYYEAETNPNNFILKTINKETLKEKKWEIVFDKDKEQLININKIDTKGNWKREEQKESVKKNKIKF